MLEYNAFQYFNQLNSKNKTALKCDVLDGYSFFNRGSSFAFFHEYV